MKRHLTQSAAAVLVLAGTLGLAACGTSAHAPAATQAQRPNILVIVADDLGYSDLGAFGSEIATPEIDKLAAQSRVLTNFHTSAMCAPTRAMLMSGADHHRVGLGSMPEAVGIFTQANKPINAPWGASNQYGFGDIPDGYRGYLSPNALSMPELLRDAGYHTYMVGKWHLAYQVAAPDEKVRAPFRIKPEAIPSARGFERTFSLLNGGAAHFAPPSPPTPADIATYDVDGVLKPAAAALPKDFYSSRSYTDKLIEFIDAQRGDGKPFFAYAAYTAPHWPLQAPDTDIAAQKGNYDEGYEVIRQRRIARMKSKGLLAADFRPNPGVVSSAEGGPGPKRWSELTPEERAREARLMEVYAAMVSNLDHHIGRLVQHLKATGAYDNTLIVFMSDNGAEPDSPFAPPIPGTQVDNSFDNIGRPGSVVSYGIRWAEVGSAPFRLFKGFGGAEGATSVPMIVKMPHQDKAAPSLGVRAQVADLLPTVLEVAGIANPEEHYKGRQVVPISGSSLLAALKSPTLVEVRRPVGSFLADEFIGGSYLVRDNWKLSQQTNLSATPVRRAMVPWALYDLKSDRGETTDLSAQHPQLMSELLADWQRYMQTNQVIEVEQAMSGR